MVKIDEIKSLTERKPFRPFAIETTGGGQILIAESAYILFPARRPELVIAFTEDGRMHIFEHDAVVRLVE